MTIRLNTLAAAGALLVLSATAANADVLRYQATLKGALETPPSATHGRGEVTAIVDTDRDVLDYTVTYSGLSGPVTEAGFGPVKGDPADPIVVAPVDPKTGEIHAVVKLTAAQITQINNGDWYFDLKTTANPGGEIRGVIRRTNGY